MILLFHLDVSGSRWLVTTFGYFANPPIVSCSSSWTSCRCKIGRANGGNCGRYWKVVWKPSQDPNLLFTATLQACVYTFIIFHISFNKRHGLHMCIWRHVQERLYELWTFETTTSQMTWHSTLVREFFFHLPSVFSVYIAIFSSLFSRLFPWSKSLPDWRLNIFSIQFKQWDLVSTHTGTEIDFYIHDIQKFSWKVLD